MRRALTVVTVVGVLFGWWGVLRPPSAFARPLSAAERVSRSKEFFEAGLAHYNLDEYAAALAAFEEGYRLKPLPLFLFNIAQAHRRLGNKTKAIEFYRTFLAQDPSSPLRAETLGYLKDLEHPPAPPPTTPPPTTTPPTTTLPTTTPPTTTLPTTPPTAPEPAQVAPPVEHPVVEAQSPPAIVVKTSDAPPRRRRWVWGVIGAGIAVVVLGAVAIGVGVGVTHKAQPPDSALGNYPVTLK